MHRIWVENTQDLHTPKLGSNYRVTKDPEGVFISIIMAK